MQSPGAVFAVFQQRRSKVRRHGFNGNGELYSSVFVQRPSPEIDFGTDVEGPSLTKQEFAEDCDINLLMSRYEKTGVITHVNKAVPQYLDLSDVPDLQRAIEIAREAETAFMQLPAAVRREFDNDPIKFVQFAEDPTNVDQLRAWGLAKPAELPPQPVEVKVVGDPPADGKDDKGSSKSSAKRE